MTDRSAQNCNTLVSAFASPLGLWPLLEAGHTLTFREYFDTTIPPDKLVLTNFDLVSNWKHYSRSTSGLNQALIDNANRLITWRFFSSAGRDKLCAALHETYSDLAHTYASAVHLSLSRYYGINRAIEAGAEYAQFLADEATLLACHQVGHPFDWRVGFDERQTQYQSPPDDPNPFGDSDRNVDIFEQTSAYIIERKSGQFGTRYTAVRILDASAITHEQFAAWLNAGYCLEYFDKTLFPPDPDDDGLVLGTNEYGKDFFAGYLSDPETFRVTTDRQTPGRFPH